MICRFCRICFFFGERFGASLHCIYWMWILKLKQNQNEHWKQGTALYGMVSASGRSAISH